MIDLCGFVVYPYGDGYVDYEIGTQCSECGNKHKHKVTNSINYIVCESEIWCEACGNSLYFAYGFIQGYVSGIRFTLLSKDGDLIWER